MFRFSDSYLYSIVLLNNSWSILFTSFKNSKKEVQLDFSTNISYTVIHRDLNKVESIRFLTENTFVIRLERNDLQFRAGQHISVGPRQSAHRREYSIYNGEQDDYLEILVREVTDGNVSQQLKNFNPGQMAVVKGAFGKLTLNRDELKNRKHVFIASGTGIAPFHSYIKSYPEIDYKMIHGVRNKEEAYDKSDYDPAKYILCTSREKNGNYHGRVTDYLHASEIDVDHIFHVCGNSKMVYEVYDILRKKGVPSENMRSEVYF